jgi:hypothetical protein
MSDEHRGKCGDPGCGCGEGEPCDCEMEIIELEDENGETEEYAVLDELDFEGRHFVIMAPLVEVQAINEAGQDGGEREDLDLSIEIFENDGEDFSVLEDEDLAARLMAHLDKLGDELED